MGGIGESVSGNDVLRSIEGGGSAEAKQGELEPLLALPFNRLCSEDFRKIEGGSTMFDPKAAMASKPGSEDLRKIDGGSGETSLTTYGIKGNEDVRRIEGGVVDPETPVERPVIEGFRKMDGCVCGAMALC